MPWSAPRAQEELMWRISTRRAGSAIFVDAAASRAVAERRWWEEEDMEEEGGEADCRTEWKIV